MLFLGVFVMAEWLVSIVPFASYTSWRHPPQDYRPLVVRYAFYVVLVPPYVSREAFCHPWRTISFRNSVRW